MDAVGGAGPDAAVAVEPEAVEQAGGRNAELPAIADNAAIDVIDADLGGMAGLVRGAGVGDIEQALVEAESEAVGAHHVGDHGADGAAAAVDAIDIAGADLAGRLVALIVGIDAVARIGEPDRAVGFDHRVIGRIEPLALKTVGQRDDCAVMFGAADPAVAVLAGDEPALPVDGVAVGIAGGIAEHRDRAVGLVVAHHAVVWDVGPDEIAPAAEIGGALRPFEAARQFFDMAVAVEQRAEAGVDNLVIVVHCHWVPSHCSCSPGRSPSPDRGGRSA